MDAYDSFGNYSEYTGMNKNVYIKDELLGGDDLFIINNDAELLEAVELKMGRPMKLFLQELLSNFQECSRDEKDSIVEDAKIEVEESVQRTMSDINDEIEYINKTLNEKMTSKKKEDIRKSLNTISTLVDNWY